MIFVTVGTQNFNFNRLLIEIDNLVSKKMITDKVIAQIGVSSYKPNNFPYKSFITNQEFDEYLDMADIVITHGGTGTIIKSLKKNKKIIIVPRSVEHKEHIDNHQEEIAEIYKLKGCVEVCNNVKELISALEKVKLNNYKKYVESDGQLKKDILMYVKETINKNKSEV